MAQQPVEVPQWDVADRMRKALREADISVQDMAEYLGVGRNTVSTWINGRIHPSVQTLRLWSLRCDRGHVHRCSVSSAIKRAMRRAGVTGTPHALRHHYGTQVLRTSGDLRTAQRALRHASPASTAIYTQVADDALYRAIAGIPA